MNKKTPQWILQGQGTIEPVLEWSFLTAGPLVSVHHAVESEETFLADFSGTLYRLDPAGEVTHHSRDFKGMDLCNWSQSGEAGITCHDSNRVNFVTATLETEWSAKFRELITAVAVAPSGDYVAISFINNKTAIYDRYKTKVGTVETKQPLTSLVFAAEDDMIAGSSDTGLLCAFDIKGELYWSSIPSLQAGDLAVNYEGTQIYVAAFSRGIQVYNAQGTNKGSYQIKGTPNKIDYSEFGERIATGTSEGHLIWMNTAGTVLWAAGTPSPIAGVQCGSCSKRLITGLSSGEVYSLRWLSS